MWDAMRGGLDTSLRQNRPTLKLIDEPLPATLELAVAATIISIFIAIPAGVLAATNHQTWIDNLTMLGAISGQSLSVFWLGIMMNPVFSVKLRLTPVSDRDGLEHLTLPAVSLAAFITARNARMVRSSMLKALNQDYIRTARAKGLSEPHVIVFHALRNSMFPVVTLLGLQFVAL